MAVLLPVLLLLLIGCVDIGRAMAFSVALSNAARVGADWGATHRVSTFTRASWEARIREDAVAEMAGLHGVAADELDIDIATFTDADGSVRVTVTADYRFETIVKWPGLPGEVPMRHAVTMCQYR
jgi:Flp pilus assembly protein TadG